MSLNSSVATYFLIADFKVGQLSVTDKQLSVTDKSIYKLRLV